MKTALPDTRQKLLDAARSVMIGRGFSAVGLSEILAVAGVPKGSFYHYFASKEQFGAELLTRYVDDYLADTQQRLTAPGVSASERLMSFVVRWHQTQSGDDVQARCLIVKLSAEVCDMSDCMRGAIEHGTAQTVLMLSRCIEEGQACGEFSLAHDASGQAQHLYQWWLGASLLARVQRRSDPLDAALQETRHWLKTLSAV